MPKWSHQSQLGPTQPEKQMSLLSIVEASLKDPTAEAICLPMKGPKAAHLQVHHTVTPSFPLLLSFPPGFPSSVICIPHKQLVSISSLSSNMRSVLKKFIIVNISDIVFNVCSNLTLENKKHSFERLMFS